MTQSIAVRKLEGHWVEPSLREAAWLLTPYDADVWDLAEKFGPPKRIVFDTLLPDRTRLSDPVNAGVCGAIKRVVFELRTGPLASCEAAGYQVIVAGNLKILVQWMQLNGIYSFSQLSPHHAESYLAARATGLEACLNMVARVATVLDAGGAFASPTEVLEAAGIDRRMRRLPGVMALIKSRLGDMREGASPEPSEQSLASENEAELSTAFLTSIASSIQVLWILSSQLGSEGLTEEPFPEGHQSVVARLGGPDARTATIPAPQGFALISAACRWVLEVGPVVLDLEEEFLALGDGFSRDRRYGLSRSAAEVRAEYQARVAALEARLTQVCDLGAPVRTWVAATSEGWTLRKIANGFIPTACLIVICAFTARRHSEALGAEHPAQAGSREDGWWFVAPILKTLKRVDATPCPEIVIAALELLNCWSRPARETTGRELLFQVPRRRGGAASRPLLVGIHLDDFANAVGVPPLADGSLWSFAPHQFRRFFAILYFWRYEGDLGALSHHLRHFDIKMTRLYVTDAELGRIMIEEGRTFTLDKLREIGTGTVKTAGLLGKRLDRHMARLRSAVEIAGDADIERKMERLVDILGLELRPSPWGYCGCRATSPALRRANCLKPDWVGGGREVDGRPDPGSSSEATCAGCLHNAVTTLHLPHWRAEIESIDRFLANATQSSIVRAAMIERRARLSAVANAVTADG